MDRYWRKICSSVILIFLAGLAFNLTTGGRQPNRKALLVIDVQRCFLPGGALPVELKDTHTLVNRINTLRTVGDYDVAVFTQDYHPANHVSFATVHHKQPAETVQLQYTSGALICDMEYLYPKFSVSCSSSNSSSKEPLGEVSNSLSDPTAVATHTVQQMMWPEHCVQDTEQVALHPALHLHTDDIIVRKGWKAHLDAYSAFLDNGEVQSTGLADLLRQRNIISVTVVGVALEYCVLWSAIDAVKLGFDTHVVLDATAPVSVGGAGDAMKRLREAGVHLQQSVREVLKQY